MGAAAALVGRLRRGAGADRESAALALADILFEDPGAGLLVVDRTGRIVSANAAMRAMAGAQRDRMLGGPATTLFAADEQRHVEDKVLAVLAGRPRPEFVSHLASMQGEPDEAVTVTVTALPAPRRDGTAARPPAGALLRVVDVTPQRRLQSQLAQAQKLQAVGSLAGGIAHDFNNLLTAILGGADAIAAREPCDPETREDVAQIYASAGRGEALVRQLLAFGRQQALQPKVLSVNERIADLVGLLRRLLGSSVRLELALEEPGRRVRADPTQLDQVLINLAVNARDAMPEGGTLTIRSGHDTLYRPQQGGAEAIPPGRYVTIEVEDTGTGIPPEVLPRIFEPFFTTRRERGGNGLGLSTVHGIVRQSDGFIRVESTVGQGTLVRIHLPRDDGEVVVPPPPPEVSPLPDLPAPRGAVLLVDDEAAVLRMAERALSRQGWRVLAADSGERALERLGELAAGESLAAVVSDMMMPGMDGTVLVQRVRERLSAPDLPALLVSGYAEASLRTAMSKTDRICFLPKPYAAKQLIARLAETVAASRL